MNTRAVVRVFAWVAVLMCGCVQSDRPDALLAPEQPKAPALKTLGRPARISQDELRQAVEEFEDLFVGTVKQAAAQIDERSPERKVRRMTLQWRMCMVPACHDALSDDHPIRAFLEGWALSRRMTDYFEKGDGRGLFAKDQQIAVDAARQIEAEVGRIGALFLRPEEFKRTRSQMDAFAAAHPIRGVFTDVLARATLPQKDAPDPFEGVIELPLAPFRALEGVDRGAEAMAAMARAADRFTDVVGEIPETARWQVELLSLNLEDHDAVKAVLARLTEFSKTGDRLVQIADALPRNLRDQASTLIAEFDSKQTRLQTTLKEAEKAVAAAGELAKQIDSTAKTVADTSRAVESAVNNIGKIMKDASGGPGKEKPPGRPFDITEYENAAKAVTSAAVEMRALAVEIGKLNESPALTARLDDVDARVSQDVRRAALLAQGLCDHLAWRAVQVLLLAFGLALLYRLLSLRMARPAK